MVNQQFATAVHILTSLACQKNGLLNSDMLAKSVDTNPVVIRRLLGTLTKSKIVITIRGQSGGVKLARDANQISLKDIYLAISPKECIAPRKSNVLKDCPVSCAINTIMTEVSEGAQNATLKFLERQTISDLAKKVQKHNV